MQFPVLLQTLGRVLREVELPPALLSPRMRQLRELLRSRLEQNPHYRFQNGLEVQLAATLGVEIDVNLAREQDWLRLPQLTPEQARRLVSLRHQGEFFASEDDLSAALGMPLESLAIWKPLLVYRYYAFADQSPESTTAPPPPQSGASPTAVTPPPRPEPAAIAPPAAPLNLNRASRAELLQIPGMEEALADRILHLRLMGGRFLDAEDFRRRLGLSPRQMRAWAAHICL